MPDLARFAVFAPATAAVPHVPQALDEWGTYGGAEITQSNQLPDDPVPLVPPVPLENDVPWDEEDWQVAFEERAAILEYDQGMTRAEAEAIARELVFGRRDGE